MCSVTCYLLNMLCIAHISFIFCIRFSNRNTSVFQSLMNRKIRVDVAGAQDSDRGGFGGRRDDEEDKTAGDWRAASAEHFRETGYGG